MAGLFGSQIDQIGQKAGAIVDRAKSIAIAGVIATFFGLVGVFTLAASMAFTLAMWMVWPAALAVTAVTFLAITAIALWIGTRPSGSSSVPAPVLNPEEEASVESAFSSLTDLPMEAARKIIAERPIAALAVFSGFGVLIARRPEIAIRLVERLIARFT
jgi:membrane protein implicated in regulation of membrane protease activity